MSVLIYSVLCGVSDGPLNQKQLASRAKTDNMMTSQVVRKLESKGLVERKVNSDDSRSIMVRPTRRGVELANLAVVAVEQVDKDFFGQLAYQHDFIKNLKFLADMDSITDK